jgi:hypothetical protein
MRACTRPVARKIVLTRGRTSSHVRVLTERGNGPHLTLVVLEDELQNQFGLAIGIFAHLPKPAAADMVVDLGDEVSVRLTKQLSISGTAVHGVDQAWRGRPIVA